MWLSRLTFIFLSVFVYERGRRNEDPPTCSEVWPRRDGKAEGNTAGAGRGRWVGSEGMEGQGELGRQINNSGAAAWQFEHAKSARPVFSGTRRRLGASRPRQVPSLACAV